MIRASGWAGLDAVDLDCKSREEAGALAAIIESELERLAPRLRELDDRLDERTRANRHYAQSKRWSAAPVRIWRDAKPSAQRSLARPAWGGRAPQFGAGGTAPAFASVLVVGTVRNGSASSRTAAAAHHLVHVASGEGVRQRTRNPSKASFRPGPDSLAHWLAMSSEGERHNLDAIVLGEDAGAEDVRLLRRRLHHRVSITTDSGSSAGAWLAIDWDGTVSAIEGGRIWRWPGPRYREPGRLMQGPLDWPKISVVTVSYNQRDYLEECIRSVVEQGYPNLEYIVIDAVSTDGSRDILMRYRDAMDCLVIEADQGQSDGLCKGFARATGDILTWVNSDDALTPNALKRAALAFMEHDVDIVAGTCERVGETLDAFIHRHYAALPTGTATAFGIDGPIRWADCWEAGDYFFQPEVFFTQDIWRRSGAGLKKRLHWAMDWDLWLRMAAAGARIVRVPDVLGVSRVQPEQKTTSDELYLPQIAGILRDHLDLYQKVETQWRSLVSDSTSGAPERVAAQHVSHA